MTSPIADAAERSRALDAGGSFLVQAPAGSGKTELLIQRFLVLLARVQAPEEIVAVTFTRKAAGEMRHRVLQALEAAAGPEPAAPHARLTWSLARAALERDRKLRWEISRYPSRLRVQTIDSLCASITRQMPRLAGFGSQPGIAENAENLYREAARRTLASLEEGGLHADAVARLLAHLDTNFDRVERMLVDMLGARDQWLRHILAGPDASARRGRRELLEGALQAVVRDSIQSVCETFPFELAEQAALLVRSAAANLAASGTDDSPILPCASMRADFLEEGSDLPLEQWLGLAHLLLTRDGHWRSRCDRSIGFPAPSETRDPEEKKLRAELKEAFKNLVAALSEPSDDGTGGELLRHRLHLLRSLPATSYPDAQWRILEALVTLLPVAVAHLRLVFQARGEVDFTEVAMRASYALGTEDNPTDLGLALDYRIHHLLVDEFQDTSLGQYRLLERLTAGWEPGDGRTLFLVGDPMQSIYRFREAEVGLFLQTAGQGRLGPVPLEFLRLRCNFRSDGSIVEWVNRTFADILPAAPDTLTGAVPYSPSIPARPSSPAEQITVHPLLTENPDAEARLVLDLVQRELEAGDAPGGADGGRPRRIAILVRSRSHLLSILPLLREARISYRALDIDPLAGRPAVQDLLSLTRALLHPADRIAWLAVLRAPWCGLTADDLHALASPDTEGAVWDLIRLAVPEAVRTADGQDEDGGPSEARQEELFGSNGQDREPAAVRQPRPPEDGTSFGPDRTSCGEGGSPCGEGVTLSRDGLERLRRVARVLADALSVRCRPPLRRWVEGTWLALGGPASVRDAADLADAREYLDLLDDLDDGGDITSFDALDERLQKLYALPDPLADGTVQVMTIHKAKGLEFEVVILPGLGRKPAADRKRLLLWAEIPELSSPQKLLLAPIEETGQSRDPIYSFIWGIHRDKAAHEAGRVLYVAATRAREHLHLIGHALPVTDRKGNPDLRRPPESTMLGLLWPAVENAFREACLRDAGPDGEPEPASDSGDALDATLSERPAMAVPALTEAPGIAETAAPLWLRRLPLSWTPPPVPPEAPAPPTLYPSAQGTESRPAEFSPTGMLTRHIGTVIHRWLRLMAAAAERSGRLCTQDQLHAQRPAMRLALAQLGVAPADLDEAAGRVLDALCWTLKDERGAWVLDPRHRDAASNLAVSGFSRGQIVTTTIDRTFVDGEGVRWIVDYRAAFHEGAGLDRFLDTQLRTSQPELLQQAELFRALHPGEKRPIRTGIYFPRLTAWREWTPE